MRERPLLVLLLAVQCVPMIDGVLLMPLAPVLMRDLGVGTGGHGVLVGGCSLAAALAGIAGVGLLDRFARRRALTALLAVFCLAELLCLLAPDFTGLLAGRLLAGAAGGLIGALVLAIVGDVVPPERRGRATGLVMSAFAVASIVGVPLGAWAGVQGHWRWPFAGLALLAALAALALPLLLPPLDGHRLAPRRGSPWSVLREIDLLRCWGLTGGAAAAGFVVIPLISPYLVGNAGLPLERIPFLYLCGGAAAAVVTPTIGRLADRLGPRPVVLGVSLAALAPILAITHLPPVPLWAILGVTTAFMVFVSGRFAALAALLGAHADPARRGAIFAINGAVASLAMGAAALTAGVLSQRLPDGRIAGYGHLGLISVGLTALSLPLLRGLARSPRNL